MILSEEVVRIYVYPPELNTKCVALYKHSSRGYTYWQHAGEHLEIYCSACPFASYHILAVSRRTHNEAQDIRSRMNEESG